MQSHPTPSPCHVQNVTAMGPNSPEVHAGAMGTGPSSPAGGVVAMLPIWAYQCCCCEHSHSCTCFCINVGFHVSGIKAQETLIFFQC